MKTDYGGCTIFYSFLVRDDWQLCGIRTLVDMTVPELEAEGLTHNEAQYASLRERGMRQCGVPSLTWDPTLIKCD